MNMQHIRRGAVILLGGLTLTCALTLLGALQPMTSLAGPLLQATLTPSAYVYLPLVLKQFSLLTPTPTNTPGPPPPVTPGHWAGTTNRGHPMSFDVSPSGTQWTNFTLKTNFSAPSCGASGTLTSVTNGPGTITNNQFGITGSTYSFTGQFSSATAATGTYAYNNFLIVIGLPYPPYVCYYYLTQSGTWSANGP